jgi:hypothetical protein
MLKIAQRLSPLSWYRGGPAIKSAVSAFKQCLERGIDGAIHADFAVNHGSVDATLQTLLECTDGTFDGWPASADGFASAALASTEPFMPTSLSTMDFSIVSRKIAARPGVLR